MSTPEAIIEEAKARGMIDPPALTGQESLIVEEASRRANAPTPAAPDYPVFQPDPFVRNPEPPSAGVNPIEGNLEALLSGASFGTSDEIQAGIGALYAKAFGNEHVSDKTLSQLMIDMRDATRKQAEEFRKQEGALAYVPEVIGGIATGGALFKGANTLRGALAVGAAEGAIAGAGYSDSEDFLSVDTALNSAVGAGLGVAGAGVFRGLGWAGKELTKKFRQRLNRGNIQIFDENGRFTDDAIDALREMDVSADDINDMISQQAVDDGVLTPEQARRFNLFADRDVPINRANLTQSVDDFADLQSAAKRSGTVADNIAAQDEQLGSMIELAAENTGGIATDAVSTNASIYSAINNRVVELDDIVTAAYRQAREVAQGQPRVRVDNLIKAIQDNRGKEQVSGGVVSSIKGVLKNKGLLRVGKDIDVNKRSQRITGEDTRLITVNEAEQIRQSLNELYDSVTPQGRRMIRQLKSAVDDDVADAVGDDIFAEARQAKINFHNAIERPARNKFDKSTASLLEDIIDNKVPEEKILDKLIVSRGDDFDKVKSFLTRESGEQGQQAWLDMKGQMFRNALDKATQTQGKTSRGGRVFNARLFGNEFKKLRASGKFDKVFNADEQKLIDDVIEIGYLRIPQGGVQQGKGPTELAVKELQRSVLENLPFGPKANALREAALIHKIDKRLLDVTRETESALR